METRARYILVGAFTLLSLLATLGFLLWLARVQVNRTYAQYDIVLDSVAGLNQASVVRYNGVDVGNVLSIALDTQNPALVRVRIEIYATTPVRKDTVATLASQGVTGVTFVALEGGSPTSGRLEAIPPARVPVIASKPSVVQELTDRAPDLLNEAIALIEEVRTFTTPENKAALAEILQNVKSTTARIDGIATRAETLVVAAEATLGRADAALDKAEAAFSNANEVIENDIPELVGELKTAVSDVGDAAASLKTFAQTDLPQFGVLAGEARNVLQSIRALVDRIGSDPGRFLLGNQTPDYRN
jgi:phospholipid/cholesterol/gamma-HCH transport system substrate-binding protein